MLDKNSRQGCINSKLVLVVLLSGALPINCASAQITPDKTLSSESSIVTPNAQIDRITGGAIRGSNLFHSFLEFNVSQGRGAYFISPNTNIQNILARVTGNNPSQILGTLGIIGNSQANLFLINPQGIIFGQNASLDVGGSFIATTANAIKFGETGLFSASEPASSNLLSVQPSALFFNALANQGAIVNRSTAQTNVLGASFNGQSDRPINGLNVLNGRSLLLVGGNVNLDGGIVEALGGRVELGGLAAPGTVGINNLDGNNFSLSFPVNVTRADVSLTNNANLNVASGNGGSIAINARNLEVSGGSVIRGGIVQNQGSANSQAGDIALNATGEIKVVGSDITNDVESGAMGQGGNLSINTGSLSITDGGQVSASTSGSGNAGSLSVTSPDIQLRGTDANGSPSGLFTRVESNAKGDGGNLSINTSRLSISDGANISASTFGMGNSGSLTIKATDSVQVDNGSSIAAQVEPGGVGNAGSLTIETGRLNINSGGFVSASTFGEGKAGSLSVTAPDIQLRGKAANGNPSGLFTTVESNAKGDGGNLSVNTSRLSISDGAGIGASTFGMGNSGSLTIKANDSVQVDNGSSIAAQVESGGVGNAGSLTIETGRLNINSGGQVSASTLGEGKAGSLSVTAPDIQLRGKAANGSLSGLFTRVESNAKGDGGNLSVNTSRLSISDGASIGASTIGMGNSGSLTIKANDSVQVDNGSSIAAQVEPGGVGNAGSLTIETGRLNLSSGGFVSASTVGEGKAGSLSVTAPDIQLRGKAANGNPSGLFTRVESNAKGDGGNLSVNTSQLSVSDGANLSASTSGIGKSGNLTIKATDSVQVDNGGKIAAQVTSSGVGNAGSLTIETGRLNVSSGGQVSASTLGEGNAGSLSVTAPDIQLRGRDANGFASGLFASVGANAKGSGGNLNINTQRLRISDRALVAVSSTGIGTAGNLEIQARDLRLDNQGSITAKTNSGNGGNINLQLQDLLLLRHGSSISTTAGDNLNPGNGGNITINTPFIVAVPSENSDISANAFTGNGGRVTINSFGIFGIQSRSQPTPESDITASSTSGVGLQGIVNINTPGIDPSRGLAVLPENIVDRSRLIASGCNAGDAKNSDVFFATGRGGLPPNPADMLGSEVVWQDTRFLVATVQRSQPITTKPDQTEILPAQGWVFNDKGEVTLIAHTPNTTPYGFGSPVTKCSAR